MEHLLNDHELCPDQHENNKTTLQWKKHSPLSLTEIQWKPSQKHDQNILIERKVTAKPKMALNLFQGRGEGAVWQTPIPGGGGIFTSPIILGNI